MPNELGSSACKKYNMLDEHQRRVIDEKKELEAKIDKLSSFIDNSETYPTLDESERYRLREQRSAMLNYSRVLSERIDYFLEVQK